MGIAGVEQLFHLIYEIVHWIINWTVPCHAMVEAHERGVLVRGPRVRVLEPGDHYYHKPRTSLYTVNVKTKVNEPQDIVITTSDDFSVRVGLSFTFEIRRPEVWSIENEDADTGILTKAQRVVIDYAREREWTALKSYDVRDLTKEAQRRLGRKFGVKVHELGITTFTVTEAKDINHSGAFPAAALSNEDE